MGDDARLFQCLNRDGRRVETRDWQVRNNVGSRWTHVNDVPCRGTCSLVSLVSVPFSACSLTSSLFHAITDRCLKRKFERFGGIAMRIGAHVSLMENNEHDGGGLMLLQEGQDGVGGSHPSCGCAC